VTGPGQGPLPAGTAAEPLPDGAAASPRSGDQAVELRPGEQFAGPEGHVCIGCGCRIAQGLIEVRVRFRGRRGTRYRHAGDGCADALRAPQPNKALIGRYEALPTFRWDPKTSRPGAQGTAS
jgi:hypothetical protein